MPEKNLANHIVLFISIVALITSAYISVTLPISEQGIPFTAQSLVVFCIAGLLNTKNFFIVIVCYLCLGALGVPVFAEGTSGIDKLLGSSGGFLYGFAFSGLVISWWMHRQKSAKLMSVLAAMLIGTIVLFIFGLGHLSGKFGLEKALEYGLYSFWQMALVKAILATFLVFGVKRLLARE